MLGGTSDSAATLDNRRTSAGAQGTAGTRPDGILGRMSPETVPTPIEEYAVLGDLGTAALVSRRGSIDWLCLPRFDSHACFAALLGTPEHGRWLLGPADEDAVSTRRYVDGSFVLETVHRTATGAVRVTDLMPIADGRADVLRRVEGLEGTVRMVHEWVVRFGYGATRPWVTRRARRPGGPHRHTSSALIAGPDMLVLRGQRLPHAQDGHHVDEFDVTAGEVLTFSTTWFPSHEAGAATPRGGGPHRAHHPPRPVVDGATATTRGRTPTPSPGRCSSCASSATASPAASSRRRRRASRRTSAACATGTTASAGCATPP